MSFGFTNIYLDKEEKIKYLNCVRILVKNNIYPNKLKTRLETVCAEYVGKYLNFFP
jgi:hypothetical protein